MFGFKEVRHGSNQLLTLAGVISIHLTDTFIRVAVPSIIAVVKSATSLGDDLYPILAYLLRPIPRLSTVLLLEKEKQ